MWSGNLKTAIGNLRSAKWRSLLTMLGIIIGVSSVVTVVSLGEGLKQQVVGQIHTLGSDVLTVRPGKLVSASSTRQSLNLLAFLSTSTLSEQDVTTISKLPSVSAVVPVDFVTNSVTSDSQQLDNVSVLGTGPELYDLLRPKVDIGAFFTKDNTADNVAVIGSGVATQLYGGSNPIGHSISVLGQDFIIRGELAPSAGGLISAQQSDLNQTIFLPLGPAKNLVSGRTNILQILVKTKPSVSPDTAVTDIRHRLLQNRGGIEDFSVLKQQQLLDLTNGVVDTATGFTTGLAAVALLVGGIGIMDIMLVSVSERTREIGIRKAIGATNRQILSQFLIEGLVLTIGGGFIGIAVSLIIFGSLRLYTSLHPVINAPVMILAVSISVIVGIIFSVAPALKAARKNPIDALRG
jgi:putative ABC transport system permease protein